MVVRHDLFTEQSLHNRSAELVRNLYDFLTSAARALADEYDGLRRLVEYECGKAQLLFVGDCERRLPAARRVRGPLVHREFARRLLLLIVNGKRYVRDAAVVEC